jgi:hypothetical protein
MMTMPRAIQNVSHIQCVAVRRQYWEDIVSATRYTNAIPGEKTIRPSGNSAILLTNERTTTEKSVRTMYGRKGLIRNDSAQALIGV